MIKYILTVVASITMTADASAQSLSSAAYGNWRGVMNVQSDSCGFSSYPAENFRHKIVAGAISVFVTDQNNYLTACYLSSCLSNSAGTWNFRTVGSGYSRWNRDYVAAQAYEYTGVRNNRANVRRILVLYRINAAGKLTGQSCTLVYAGTGRR